MLTVILMVVVTSSFAMLGVFAITGVAMTAMTLWRARCERELAEDLDNVLAEILGPRTSSQISPSGARNSRHPSR